MKSGFNCVINVCIFAVLINLVLPFVAKQFFTEEELNSNKEALPVRDLIIHMLLHRLNHPFISSVAVAFFVALSITLGYNFKILD